MSKSFPEEGAVGPEDRASTEGRHCVKLAEDGVKWE